ncbi:XkdX family protein [Lachnospiraceae bacterium NSJ-143]|nr:XkdX family protein [Lachnospiraceae bacterium NSJ-143]
MFKIVKDFYDKGIYSDKDVAKFVISGKINLDEYKEITGNEYKS